MNSLNGDGGYFKYIIRMFLKLPTEKTKAGIIDGPQIGKLWNDQNFRNCITAFKKSERTEFFWEIENFLGDKKPINPNTLSNYCCTSTDYDATGAINQISYSVIRTCPWKSGGWLIIAASFRVVLLSRYRCKFHLNNYCLMKIFRVKTGTFLVYLKN